MTKFGDFDFSILHTYPWYLQKVALNISNRTLHDFRLNDFFDIPLIKPGTSFHNLATKIGTACLSFSRLNFWLYILFLEHELVL